MQPQPKQKDIAAPSRKGVSFPNLVSSPSLLSLSFYSAIHKAFENKWVRKLSMLGVGLLAGVAASSLVHSLFFSPFENLDKANLLDLPIDKRIELYEKVRANNNELVKAILSAITPLVAPLATIWVAYLTIQNSQATTKENSRLTNQSQLSDRFTKATEMLSDGKPYRQAAGINILFNIAKDNNEYLSAGIDVLASFIRDESSNPLRRHAVVPEDEGIDRATGLPIKDEVLPRIAEKYQTALQLAINKLLVLQGFAPSSEPLPLIKLSKLDLKYLIFDVKLIGVLFIGADLRGATFQSPLSFVYFTNADLGRADFSDAVFGEDVSLTDADVSSADFSKSEGLTWSQLLSARSSGGTKLPPNLLDPKVPGKPDDFDPSKYDPNVGWSNQPKAPPTTSQHP